MLDLALGLAQVIAQGLGDVLGTAAALIPGSEKEVFEQTRRLR
ncbi:MAG: hypothetical protein SH859_07460 [Hyphomicrobium aestuarii]|nr:hypothetical protein [Hyphomicrobium aestuarii]